MKEDNAKDAITTWLDNAGRHPVLTPDRVCMIAREIQSLPDNSPRRRRLVNTLVRHNLRLVVSFVKSFLAASPRQKWGCAETVDYLQVGAIGLIRAAELYDPTKGYTFATYANYWIRSKVSRYSIKNRSLVHVSESMSRKIIFYTRNGYLKSKANGKHRSDDTVLPMLREAKAALSCASLNVPNDEGRDMINEIPDRSRTTGSHLICEDIHQALDNAGVSLLGKEVLMAHLVYEETCPQIASRLSLTPARIRQEKEHAMELARASKELAGLV